MAARARARAVVIVFMAWGAWATKMRPFAARVKSGAPRAPGPRRPARSGRESARDVILQVVRLGAARSATQREMSPIEIRPFSWPPSTTGMWRQLPLGEERHRLLDRRVGGDRVDVLRHHVGDADRLRVDAGADDAAQDVALGEDPVDPARRR